MTKPIILLLEHISDEAFQLLEDNATVITATAPDQGLSGVENQNIDAIITRGKGKVDQALILACRGLKAIGRCGVGLDNVDVNTATTKNVKVINAPGSNADTVAEHTLALMLTAQRKIYDTITQVRNKLWTERSNYNGDEIRGKVLGIVGMGDIGKKVAALASAFGMKIIYWNRSKVDSKHENVNLDSLLSQSDIVSLHLALNDQTKGFFNAHTFSKNKKSPLLINTSRGGIIVDDEIKKALDKGYISGFAADVLSLEPPSEDNVLLQAKNVYITSHTASLTKLTFNEMCVLTVENVLNALEGKDINDKFIFNRNELGQKITQPPS